MIYTIVIMMSLVIVIITLISFSLSKETRAPKLRTDLFDISHYQNCPICNSGLKLATSSTYNTKTGSIIVEGKAYTLTFCEKGCFARKDHRDSKFVTFYLFGDKKYEYLCNNEVIQYSKVKYSEEEQLDISFQHRKEKYKYLVKDIEFYKENNRYVAEWLDNNVFKLEGWS